MSSERNYHEPEQDEYGGDDLPTYDELAAQSGPNSRFGRWRGWIEKRAAERYTDITPDERMRRRERGWGDDTLSSELDAEQSIPVILNEPPTPTPLNFGLHLRTDLPPPPPPKDLISPSPAPAPLISQSLAPTHLRLNQFGSRFLPHSASPIRCLLPLLADRLLLIGHDEGLSVLDMFPKEWTEDGHIMTKGPDEAQARPIWQGEGVFQMSILEVENHGDGTPQGVVLALVGPEPDTPSSKDGESLRTLRMYNLASLTSLAKWATTQKGVRPLDLHRPSNWSAQQTPTKKHRSHASITQSIKSLIESPNAPHQSEPHVSIYPNLLPPSTSTLVPPKPKRQDTVRSMDSGWEMVDDLPLRWATDFVPLASAGSRLVNTSVLSYALKRDENRRGRGGALLAVATKSNILLYETPRGERAFRFVKEFYTPLQPRSITFVEQSVQSIIRRPSDSGPSSSRHSHRLSSGDSAFGSRTRCVSAHSPVQTYDSQRSLFVTFEKKAGVIRIADSAVGEVELFDDNPGSPKQDVTSTPSSIRRPRTSVDSVGLQKEQGKGLWIPPSRAELPTGHTQADASSKTVYFLTRGKNTHIIASPLPATISAMPPLYKLTWESTPAAVTPRICYSSEGKPPFLQMVAFGEDGVEVQEISLSFLGSKRGKGKGKGRAEESLRSQEDLCGDTGFLCPGGLWHRLYDDPSDLSRSYSVTSDVSRASFDSLETDELVSKARMEQGIYGWCRKGFQDFRVFWVGGSGADEGRDDLRD